MPDPHVNTPHRPKSECINARALPEIPLRRSRKMEVPRPHKRRAEGGNEEAGEEFVVQFCSEEVVAADTGLGAGGNGARH